MPQKRFEKLLEQAQRDCCKARNAAITHWLVWRRQNPDWEPGGKYDPPPRKIKRKARPVDPNKKPPSDPKYAPREFMSRELYDVATKAAPNIAGTVASSCVQEVGARLKANTPYNHEGKARWVWQAILDSEVSLPTWRGGRIPCPRSGLVITYTEDRCEARIPLLSKKSGYARISPTVRLLASDLKAGNRRILKAMADGTKRYADSQIVEKKGRWFLQLVYDVPVNAVDLPTENVLTLMPTLPDDKWPFVMHWTNQEGEERRWFIGYAKPLIAEYRRIETRRRSIRYRYKDGAGSGHGKQRWYQNIKPMSRAVSDMGSRFQKLTIADIIKFAIRENCGSVMYREPTMPVRDNSWFTKQDVPFEWTQFQARLSFSCEKAGLQYDTKRIGMGEWRPKQEKAAG